MTKGGMPYVTRTPEALCDDDNQCTSDSCAAAAGCSYVDFTGGCNDGVTCTTGDSCATGTCLGIDSCPAAEVCDGANGCAKRVANCEADKRAQSAIFLLGKAIHNALHYQVYYWAADS